MTNNNLFIHIESGNIFYQNFNTFSCTWQRNTWRIQTNFLERPLWNVLICTKSHSLVSLQFLCTLDMLFGGNISLSNNALIELYCNLSYQRLSGGRDFKFEAISDLTADKSFQMKCSTLLHLQRKSEQDKKSNNDIKNSHDFFEKPEDDEEFENEPKKKTFLKSLNM